MQIGDLVELSAAGNKAMQNMEVRGLWGMIVEIAGYTHPYKINWFRPDGSLKSVPMARHEIKFMRGKK